MKVSTYKWNYEHFSNGIRKCFNTHLKMCSLLMRMRIWSSTEPRWDTDGFITSNFMDMCRICFVFSISFSIASGCCSVGCHSDFQFFIGILIMNYFQCTCWFTFHQGVIFSWDYWEEVSRRADRQDFDMRMRVKCVCNNQNFPNSAHG